MKYNSMIKRCFSALIIFALVLTSIIVMPAHTQAAAKYSKSASKILEDKNDGASSYLIPIDMKKDGKITVTVEYLSKSSSLFSFSEIVVYEYISDWTEQVDEGKEKGECKYSDGVDKYNKKSTVTINAKKGNKSGILVDVYGGSKVKVTVKCGKSYVKLGKVIDYSIT